MRIIGVSMNQLEYEKFRKIYDKFVKENGIISMSKFIKMRLGICQEDHQKNMK